ncbi:MAG: pyridoxamine kinase [Peptostreptococcus sp.]|uniref:pyridoxamine kinase n=1 Tax=Peptostreptococcus sp. TaxID=1262 RepID=UPI002FC6F058
MKNMQKKVACVNDISGVGKCSLTVALPIISALKCQCCPLPTSVLSSQTGYPKYTFTDLTDSIQEYIQVWHDLGQEFDTIYSGFLGSAEQIKLVENLINLNKNSFVIVDPVLADLGVLFPIFDDNHVNEMKKLVSMANLITPNITEANLLAGRKADSFDYDDEQLLQLCRELSDLGPKSVIITGFETNGSIMNICYDSSKDTISKIGNKYNKLSFSGTGDIFTSIVTGMVTRGFDINDSVKCATDFIYDTVNYTVKDQNFDRNDGILFESFLDRLVSI